jgi:hypothetical protein
MVNSIKHFSDNFYKLSAEVQFYYSSDLVGDLIVGIIKEYDLNASSFYDLIFDVINSNFDFDLIKKYLDSLGVKEIEQKKFTGDFIGQLFWPVAAYLKTADIKKELTKNGDNPDNYSKYVIDFYNLIEDESWKNLDKLLEVYDKDLNKEEEKIAVLDLFNKDLINILKAPSLEAIKRLNGILIFLLNNVNTFPAEIFQALSNNKLKVTNKPLIIDDRKVEPTVANWLKNFIKLNGSDFFDNLVLASYLSKDSNVKNLNDQEKMVLQSLLKLYRNLVFFPENMSDVPVENWEIFPISQEEEEKRPISGLKDVLGADQSASADKSKIYSNPLTAQLVDLEKNLKDYSSSGLEYKALSQEISRLKRIALKAAQQANTKIKNV